MSRAVSLVPPRWYWDFYLSTHLSFSGPISQYHARKRLRIVCWSWHQYLSELRGFRKCKCYGPLSSPYQNFTIPNIRVRGVNLLGQQRDKMFSFLCWPSRCIFSTSTPQYTPIHYKRSSAMKLSQFILLSLLPAPLALGQGNSYSNEKPSSVIEAETDRLLFEMTISEFQKECTSPFHSPELDWRNNGCTSALDKPFGYNFFPSCQRHDFCYLNYRKQGRYEKLKASCDDNFQRDMYRECAKHSGIRSRHCRSVARLYHWAVKTFGDNYKMYQLPADMFEALETGDAVGSQEEEDLGTHPNEEDDDGD